MNKQTLAALSLLLVGLLLGACAASRDTTIEGGIVGTGNTPECDDAKRAAGKCK